MIWNNLLRRYILIFCLKMHWIGCTSADISQNLQFTKKEKKNVSHCMINVCKNQSNCCYIFFNFFYTSHSYEILFSSLLALKFKLLTVDMLYVSFTLYNWTKSKNLYLFWLRTLSVLNWTIQTEFTDFTLQYNWIFECRSYLYQNIDQELRMQIG